MIRVLTYGTFDLFHVGHLRILERLRSLGDHLSVGVSTDEFNLSKGKRCVIPFTDRAQIVSALRCVDNVIPESCWEQKISDVAMLEIDIFGMGDDWLGHFDFLRPHCQVIYLPRTPDVSSTMIRTTLGEAKIETFSRIQFSDTGEHSGEASSLISPGEGMTTAGKCRA